MLIKKITKLYVYKILSTHSLIFYYNNNRYTSLYFTLNKYKCYKEIKQFNYIKEIHKENNENKHKNLLYIRDKNYERRNFIV